MMSLSALTKHRLCYLATPYSKFWSGVHNAFVEASIFAAHLMKHGVKVYSPIAHTHPLAIYGNIDPLDHSIWLPFDEAMMDVCTALIVAEMDGWKDSKGIRHEIKYFERQQKLVHYLPGEMFK